MAAQERECVNFPIQGTVADTLSVALGNLWAYRQAHPQYQYRILLAIHDAVILEVPVDCLEHVMDFVIPTAMVANAMVPATRRSAPFYLDVDKEVLLRWGEAPSRDELKDRGVPERFLPQD
jgi:DNA polymerase I-like protein with 3'-5' exonuclease and polymerase domains